MYFLNKNISTKFVFWACFIDEAIYGMNKLHHVGLIIFLFADIAPTKAKDKETTKNRIFWHFHFGHFWNIK